MKYTINEKNYTYASDYKDNDVLRGGFNRLTKQTYGFDFEQWYQDGYWGNSYIPHSVLDGEMLVANVSISIINFSVLEKNKRYIQIGTVMTDQRYRNQGLSRFLMEKIIDQWEENCDLIYLFANDSVIDFYPKFGFSPINEYQYYKQATYIKHSFNVIPLDMSVDKNRQLVFAKALQAASLSKIAMQSNASLIMFYLTSFMKNHVYYIEEIDTVAVAEYDENILCIHDVFGRQDVLEEVVNIMLTENVQKVILGFSPCNDTSYNIELLKEEDTTLFVKGNDMKIFSDNKIRFPILSHA
ncbi:hypothetical protein JBW_02602 [Pelosinus fermentans JBW45]|uniref:N-acetyltransferase domain-containing protein n=2 Tax=Pelosinus TaxID=365348 RepID=I9NY72_9FIRM|nr:hypothetical protein JBW_02602 [Pelosinus fermentans JBW45]